MPPKFKFTKDEIVSAAFGIVREGGEDALTAREVAKRLGSSTSPIFTVFSELAKDITEKPLIGPIGVCLGFLFMMTLDVLLG